MKKLTLIMIGLILIIFVMICPFPTILAVPGAAWRMIIGLLGCFLLALGIYKAVHKK